MRKWKRDEQDAKDRVVICYAPQICPDVMRVRLPYVQLARFSGTGIANQVFRGNSCFDPDQSGIGTQPLGHDQWSALYRRYRVLASKVTVQAASLDDDANLVYIVPLNTSAFISSRETVLENEKAKTLTLGQQAGSSRGSLQYYMDTAKQRGTSKDGVKTEIDYSADVGNNPTLQWYWHVGVLDLSSALQGVEVDLMVKVEYFVEYFDRETLSSS